MSLPPAFLDELRARTSLSTLIARTVKLQRAGREMKGCCPFHNEKTPSFYVNDDKGFYHCFGCSAHGDAIRWMTDQRGLPFMDAVKELAQAAGLEVPAPDPRQQERQERANSLHDVMQAAADWFVQQLGGLDGAAARDLLDRRGIDARAQRIFGIGYAPDSRGRLRTALNQFGDAMLVEAGLLIQVEDKEPYDRFRGRLMIPIRDGRGRVIAFGGRVIGDGEPKYLNSPDTPLFDKGRTLYNLDRALPAARKAARVVVVEGYMDAIALARAGIDEAVAPLGTALTEAQLERLWRMADVPLLCFDGDSAGQKAALRAAHRALPMLQPGRSLAFATLPPGQDPDDLVRAGGAQAIEPVLRAAEPLVQRLWASELTAEPLDTPEQRAGLGTRLRALARQIQHEELRAEYLATYNRMIWDQFHPERPSDSFRRFSKKEHSRQPVSERLKAIAQHGIDEVTHTPALIKGLIRFPDMIRPLAETLLTIPIKAQKLRITREVLFDAALDDPDLTPQRLEEAIKKEGRADVLLQMKQVTLAYSFLDARSSIEQAKRDLELVTNALSVRPQLDAEIKEAQSRHTEWSEGDFATYSELVRERQAVDQAFQDALMPDELQPA